MSDQFLAEIRIFPFNFPPNGWAFCQGQIMPLSQNTALFSLLGTMYGGDGKSTFALPDLKGRAPMHPNDINPNSAYSQRALGEESGVEAVTLLQTEIPVHNHTMYATSDTATTTVAANNQFASVSSGGSKLASASGQLYSTNVGAANSVLTPLNVAGGSEAHNNMMPYLTLNFCIALQGVFPARYAVKPRLRTKTRTKTPRGA